MQDLKDFYRKYKWIIWPVCTAVASIVILVFVIFPHITTYFETRTKISDIRSRSGVLEAKAQELEQIDQVQLDKDLQVAFNILPETADVPLAMVVLQDAVAKSGLILKNTNYVTSQKLTEKNDFKFSVTVLGQLSSIRNLLLNLHNSPFIFQIDSINAKFQQGDSLIEAEIPVTAFYEPGKVIDTPLEGAIPKLTEGEERLLAELSRISLPQDAFDPNLYITSKDSGSINKIPDSSTDSVPLGKLDPFE